MPARAKKKWQVACSPEQFLVLRTRPDFQQLIALARWANAYRSITAAIPKHSKKTPAYIRQKINSVLFIAALVCEGWTLIKGMGEHYRTYPAWEKGFGPILKNDRFRRLVETRLGPLRNQAVFHFFADETARRLAEHEPDGDPVVFLSTRGTKSHEASYDLADLIAIRTLCPGPGQSAGALFAQAEAVGEQISQLAPPFLKAADELIAEALSRMGFKEQ